MVGFDDLESGPRTKHVVCGVIYSFQEPNEYAIRLRWQSTDLILLLNLLYWEFKYMPANLDDNYKPIFVYNGIQYYDFSEKLIDDILKSETRVGVIMTNIPIIRKRSQILLFIGNGHGDVSWLDNYYLIKNENLL